MNEKKIKMIEKVVRDFLLKSGFIVIMYDGWSSCVIESYSIVIVYFIISVWEL